MSRDTLLGFANTLSHEKVGVDSSDQDRARKEIARTDPIVFVPGP